MNAAQCCADIQTRVEQIVSAQVPERIHSSAATHVFTTVRGDGRCMVSAVQQGIGLSEYRKVARDERGVPLGEETADAEQQQSQAAVQRLVVGVCELSWCDCSGIMSVVAMSATASAVVVPTEVSVLAIQLV